MFFMAFFLFNTLSAVEIFPGRLGGDRGEGGGIDMMSGSGMIIQTHRYANYSSFLDLLYPPFDHTNVIALTLKDVFKEDNFTNPGRLSSFAGTRNGMLGLQEMFNGSPVYEGNVSLPVPVKGIVYFETDNFKFLLDDVQCFYYGQRPNKLPPFLTDEYPSRIILRNDYDLTLGDVYAIKFRVQGGLELIIDTSVLTSIWVMGDDSNLNDKRRYILTPQE